MNKFIVVGRLTKDPEERRTQSGKAIASFTLAVDGPKVNGEKTTDFLDFSAWDKVAELLVKYKHKGDQILVEGRIKKRSYEASDGSKRYVTDLIVNNVEFVGSASAAAQPRKQVETEDFGRGDGEEIPF